MKETLEAIKHFGIQTIIIYPNSDAGGRKIVEQIKEYSHLPFIKSYKSLSQKDYLSLLKYASVMAGNSSSGIIEAPSFKLPVINIGKRQEGRERANNVIDVDYNREKIIKAIDKALYDKRFRKELKKCKSPYGDGKASLRIAKILSEIKIGKENKKILEKKIAY